MSWIFLAGDRVFKLKKPVRYPYLDFSTLAARKRFCNEEVRLNRRLAPGVYRGAVPLRRTESGLSLGREGEIVDWLVEMERLPAECMLDVRLKAATVDRSDVERIAQFLARFYRRAERPQIDSAKPFRRFRSEMADNRAVLTRLASPADWSDVESLLDRVDGALQKAQDVIEERARSGHIVDGHGDLRPEHICLTEPVVIFDCLEFNRDLRLVDPFDELAFLGMECTCLGAPWFGPVLTGHVARLLGEDCPDDLVAIYTALHAVLRARLSLAHLLDPVPREPAKWAPLAKRYLDLAQRALG